MKAQGYYIFFVWFLLSLGVSAQDNLKIETIDGREFYMHNVEQGITLYSISKKYKVSVADIQKENPELEAGLKLGQVLKIPLDRVVVEKLDTDTIIPVGYQAHIVAQGETLYALSRKYSVTVREILEKNPSVVNGLKLGQRLLVPLEPTKPKSTLPEPIVRNNEELLTHTVDSGETLYSLSRFYEVSADSIMKLNDGLPRGLQRGMTLLIPKLKPNEVIMVSEVMAGSDTIVLSDSVALSNVYELAVILPFYLDTNQALDEARRDFDKDGIYPKSRISIQFYQGVLLAVDSMRKQGLSIKLYVFDSENDTSVVKEIIDRPEMKEMDLIIGPLYRENFMLVADFAKENRISIVSPVPQSNKILLGNPYVSKVSASRMIQVEHLAKYVVQNHADDNVYVFNNYEGKNIKFVDHFHKIASRELDSIGHETLDSIREVYFADISAKRISVLLDSTVNNVIVIPSNDQAFVSEFLTQLNQLSKDYDITIFGLDRWKGFENISTDYMHNLNVHITSSTVLNYHNQEEKIYMRRYRDAYNTDPGLFGFSGFDVTYYFLTALRKYGSNFQSRLPQHQSSGIITSFDFYQTSMESGFENGSAHILKYQDYQLVEMK